MRPTPLLPLLLCTLTSAWVQRSPLLDRNRSQPVCTELPNDDCEPVFVSPRPRRTLAHGFRGPPGASSLVFVFDVTGSMYDDLVQVRDGAQRIFNTVLEQRQQLIYNFALVPFHDPEVGPITVTRDVEYFQQKLNNLYVQGGGDCPEMAIGGIKLALESSLPSSFIYVFTDARSKDYHLTDQVIDMIQRTQSQVVFVMTGDCSDRTHPGYLAFDRIASTSNGQVFHLQKQDVRQVLTFVEETVQARKLRLESLSRKNGGTFIDNIPIDSMLREVTVSLSGGKHPTIELITPSGRPVHHSKVEKVLELDTVLVLNVKEPSPGVWQVRTTTNAKHTVRATAVGGIDFGYAFSAKRLDSIRRAHDRPLAGVHSYLYINMTDLKPPGRATKVTLTDLEGNELYTEDLRRKSEAISYLYDAGPFLAPNGYFYIRVNGNDERGFEFQRVSKTAVSTESGGSPRIYVAERISAYRNEATQITCDVVSRVPYTFYWYKDRRRIGGPFYYSKSESVTWSVPKADNTAVGEYRCMVSSAGGNMSAYTLLEIKEHPPTIASVQNQTVAVGDIAHLVCRTQATGQYALQWRRRGAPMFGSRNVIEYRNGSLIIRDVRKADEGSYTCIVSNSAGSDEKDIQLTVVDPPRVFVSPATVYFTERSTFNLTCVAYGYPKPKVEWFFNNKVLRPDMRHFITYKYDLIIRQAVPEDQGLYECRATSLAGVSAQGSKAKMAIQPVLNLTSTAKIVERDASVILECNVLEGFPPPSVVWYKDGREIADLRSYVRIQGQRLIIQRAQEADAGSYSCVAKNVAGQSVEQIAVDVGNIPSIVPNDDKVAVHIGRNVQLPCRVTGHPKPTVTWTKDGQSVSGRYTMTYDGSLMIRDAELKDEGKYVCTAENVFGLQKTTRVLKITGLIPPVLGHVSPTEQILLGATLNLECKVVLGTPAPTLRWLKDGRAIATHNNYVIQGEGTHLVVRNVRKNDGGKYRCVASNAAGNATLNFDVSIIAVPTILPDEEIYYVNEQTQVEIPCRAEGTPQPTISWSKDGRAINADMPRYQTKPNGLLIYNVKKMDDGFYVCRANNIAGQSRREVKVEVRTRPKILPSEPSASVHEGGAATLKCDAQAEPKPAIKWLYQGRPLPQNDRYYQQPDGSLLVRNANANDKGQYTCVAKNDVGEVRKRITLDVFTTPRISGSGQLRRITVVVNSTAKLDCHARADPPPKRYWYHEDQQVHPYGSELRFTGEGGLEIIRTQVKHGGQYRCVVSNVAGNDSITYVVDVHEPPHIFSDIPGTIDVVLGMKLEIACRAVGTPKPAVSWKKNNILVPTGAVTSESVLFIKEAKKTDEGRYSCEAVNSAGKDQRTTNVVVQVPPKIIQSSHKEASVIEGHRTELVCMAHGSPNPTVTWFRSGVEVTPQSDANVKILPGGGLVLLRARKEDHGIYLCSATNVAGEDTRTIKLTVVVIPEIPDKDVIPQESVDIGSAFSLYCPVLTTPVPEITWELNNAPLLPAEGRIELSNENRRLHILKSSERDAGVYKCIARNAAGETTKTFTVEVFVPPHVDEDSHEARQSVILGHSITLTCPAQGLPKPKINWLMHGQLIKKGQEPRGIRLVEEKDQIVIAKAQVEHETGYVCVASNPAGTLDIDIDLRVLEPPKSGQKKVISETEGTSIHIDCNLDADPNLPLSTIWLKGNVEMRDVTNGGRIVAVGKKLYFKRLQVKDTGSYSCIVRNEAGEGKMQFDLSVIVAPKFDQSDYKQDINLPLGHSTVLDCSAAGIPDPKYIWVVDGVKMTEAATSHRDLQRSPDGKTLRITQASLDTARRFTCEAGNKAGTVSRDFFVDVVEPPNFTHGQQKQKLRANEGGNLMLLCLVNRGAAGSDSNSLKIEWRKGTRTLKTDEANGMKLSLDKTRLHLLDVEEEDGGLYSCVVRNNAGEAKKEFDVFVNVAPELAGQPNEKITKIEGDRLALRCDATGSPPPTIRWLKEGAAMPPHANVAADKQSAVIAALKPSDAGSYFCLVNNVAGKAEKTFQVEVIAKPQVSGSDEVEVKEVMKNASITLECPVIGDTAGIEYSWMKDDRDIRPDRSIQVLAGGRHLAFSKAGEGLAGKYRCVVSNAAGSSGKTYELIVLVPPVVKTPSEDYRVSVGDSLTLSCESHGVPEPKAAWIKDGRSVEKLPLVELISGGKQLSVSSVELQHAGHYICQAENKAGVDDVGFSVEVIPPPQLGSADDTVTVAQNETAELACPVDSSTQYTSISWTKGDTPVVSDRSKYLTAQREQKLLIFNAQSDDENIYRCVVKNQAGETSADIHLVVELAPKILILPSQLNQTVFVNKTITLNCPASGKPEPVITWSIESQSGRNSDHVQIDGNKLTVTKAKVQDAGRYFCTATNPAGVAEQEISLSVYVQPEIDRSASPDTVDVVENDRATLLCPVHSHPRATISWTRNGRPVLTASDSIHSSAQGQKLHLVDVQPEDKGTYRCTARNAAGEDTRTFEVDVLKQPHLTDDNIASNVYITTEQETTLRCPAEGNPAPYISWLKNGEPLLEETGHVRLLDGGRQLRVSNAEEYHSGRYTCLASNSVGVMDLDIFLKVFGPPVIDSADEEVDVIEGESTELDCTLKASEPIAIDWAKDGSAIDLEDDLVYVSGQGQKLHILAVQTKDSAVYSCLAKNKAGTATKTFKLRVLVPVRFNETATSHADLMPHSGHRLEVNCIVTGEPEPVMTWQKDGSLLTMPDHVLWRSGNQTLTFTEVAKEDTGRYTCSATNIVNSVSRDFFVKVLGPPVISDPKLTKEVLVDDIVVLTCDVSGGADYTTQWTKNGGRIAERNVLVDEERVEIAAARLTDTGVYECAAVNKAGRAVKTITLTVMQAPKFIATSELTPSIVHNRPLLIDCRHTATPTATLQWFKDDEPLVREGGHYLDNRQQFKIDAAKDTDAGRYTCIAENKVGRTQKVMIVRIVPPPRIQDAQTDVEVTENSTATLGCPTNALGAEIEWQRSQIRLMPSPKIQISNGGQKLYVIKARPSDAGVYKCIVKNDAGEDTLEVTLDVLTPPRILGDTFTLQEAVVGQSATLRCAAESKPVSVLQWNKNGAILNNGDQYEIDDTGSTLIIKNVSESDSGRHTCVATNRIGTAESDIFVNTLKSPVIVIAEKEVSIVLGKSRSLSCQVSGIPAPEVNWLKNGEHYRGPFIAAGQEVHYLHLSQVDLDDHARYTCAAKNKVGSTSGHIQVDVLKPPVINTEERVSATNADESVTLECSATGTPLPTMRWLRDDKEVKTVNGHSVDSSPGSARLTLQNVQPDDGGRYSCEATNAAGVVSADFILSVRIKPYFDKQEGDVRVVEGKSITLECKAKGIPTPETSWFRSGRPVKESMSNIIQSPRGGGLMILSATRADGGTYSCIAQNDAGESESVFTVTVLVPPYMPQTTSQSVKAVEGTPVTMECPVTGQPEPEVTWLVDGRPVQLDGSRLTQEGNNLVVTGATEQDTGRYTCKAKNEAGELKSDFLLNVIGPPKFGATLQETHSVNQGASTSITCDVDATADLEITWLRDGEPLYLDRNIWLSNDGRQLTISNAGTANSGVYKCVAKNAAGTADIDITLDVYTAPQIDRTNLVPNPLAVLGRKISLECPTQGNPTPQVLWYKDGEPIVVNAFIKLSPDNQSLSIDTTDTFHQGHYKCVAVTPAGRDEEIFKLDIMAPPKLETVGPLAAKVATEGVMELRCPLVVDGPESKTMVSWSKGNTPINPNDPSIAISRDSLTLKKTDVVESDQGVYSCTAINRAGEARLEFDVEILVKPKIDNSKNEAKPFVIEGRSKTLWCSAIGNPEPNITWSKSEQLLTDSEKYAIRQKGQQLTVKDVDMTDAGTYVCTSSNELGSTQLAIVLDIWVSPSVELSGPERIKKGNTMTLNCQVEGNPSPDIRWMKDGQLLIGGLGRVSISHQGKRLDVTEFAPQDVGSYQCVAQNDAGQDEGLHAVEILLPPKIERVNIERNPQALSGQDITLDCAVRGDPMPEIVWYRGTVILDIDANPRLAVNEDKTKLTIEGLKAGDEGFYRCEAKNEAGVDDINFDVVIVASPEIEVDDPTVEVTAGNAAEILCNVTGQPTPAVTWQRNGQLLENNDRYYAGKELLRIADSQSIDAGIYVCVATNNVGVAQQAFTLEVLIPPTIKDPNSQFLEIPTGEKIEMPCLASGYPEPRQAWYKNEVLLEGDSDSWTIDEEFTLTIHNSTLKDTGKYTCVAVNPAEGGHVDKVYQVMVLIPPKAGGHKVFNVTEYSPVQMVCDVAAEVQRLQITWTMGGKPLASSLASNNPTQRLLNNSRVLVISSTRFVNDGIYQCTAKNPAGEAKQTFKLNVMKKPVITYDPVTVEATQGDKVVLPCEVVGVPKPRVTWARVDGNAKKMEGHHVGEHGLEYQRAFSYHQGGYTCNATNPAGYATKTLELIVLSAPEITPASEIHRTNVDQSVLLKCNNTGRPKPEVTWYRGEGEDALVHSSKYKIMGTSLRILRVVKGDEGFYRCVARNKVGSAFGMRQLYVEEPRNKLMWVECDEYGQPKKQPEFVRARGDLPADDDTMLPWKSVPKNGTNGVIIRCLPGSGAT